VLAATKKTAWKWKCFTRFAGTTLHA
jgi:hypothetical protein